MIRTLADRAVTASPLPLMTAREARMLGIRPTPAMLWRVRPGVYVDRAAAERLSPWHRYALRVHAFHRRHPEAILCLESAAVVLGLPLFGETRDIHVLASSGEKSRRWGDVRTHSSRQDRTLHQLDGILSTNLDDTVMDLSRVLPPAKALAVADAACSPFQGGTADPAALAERLEQQADRRGRARARWVWSRADGRAESPAESISRAVISWCGYEAPELQPSLSNEGVRDRVDFLFPSNGAIGEADGWAKYRLQTPEEAARQLTDEKLREDRLRRAGHPFARWNLSDALRVDPLRRALTAAGVRLVQPPSEALLASLTTSPRELPAPPRARR